MTLAYPLDDPRAARPASALTEAFERHGVRMAYGRACAVAGVTPAAT